MEVVEHDGVGPDIYREDGLNLPESLDDEEGALHYPSYWAAPVFLH